MAFLHSAAKGQNRAAGPDAPRWTLDAGPAGAAVRAFAWMGPAHVIAVLATLRRSLLPFEWKVLAPARGAAVLDGASDRRRSISLGSRGRRGRKKRGVNPRSTPQGALQFRTSAANCAAGSTS